jgi:hypothetical protein
MIEWGLVEPLRTERQREDSLPLRVLVVGEIDGKSGECDIRIQKSS